MFSQKNNNNNEGNDTTANNTTTAAAPPVAGSDNGGSLAIPVAITVSLLPQALLRKYCHPISAATTSAVTSVALLLIVTMY